MSVTEQEITEIRTALKRCSAETVDAAIRFRESRDAKELQTIVYGIIERYLPPENTTRLSDCDDTTRLVDDLGIDSLTMLEIVLSIEEAVQIRVENEELREIATLGEVKSFLNKKIAGGGEEHHESLVTKLDRIALIELLPHQPPFLFLDSVEIDGEKVVGTYHITGDEFFLEGHFRNNPVFPASIVFEGLGQAACAWLYTVVPAELNTTINPNEMLFASLEGAHFHRKASPGETLRFEVEKITVRPPLGVFSGAVTINGERVAEVERMMLAFAPADGTIETSEVGAAVLAEKAATAQS